MKSNGSTGDADGSAPAQRPLSAEERAQALELGHTFPGPFPVVVIARSEPDLAERLETSVSEIQGGQPFSMERRDSSGGRYASFRLELHVDDAVQALERRDAIAKLDGVVMIL